MGRGARRMPRPSPFSTLCFSREVLPFSARAVVGLAGFLEGTLPLCRGLPAMSQGSLGLTGLRRERAPAPAPRREASLTLGAGFFPLLILRLYRGKQL